MLSKSQRNEVRVASKGREFLLALERGLFVLVLKKKNMQIRSKNN